MIVDETFLNKNEIDDIKNRVLVHGLDLPWTLAYQTDINNDEYSLGAQETHSTYQFACGLVPGMPAYQYFLNIFNVFAQKHGIQYREIIRVKLNWLPRDANAGDQDWHMPHVDSDQEHMVFLYYINDSDGDTVFFNERYPLTKGSELTLSKRVKPVAGKGVVFNGFIYHASSSPVKSDFRCILNIDFK